MGEAHYRLELIPIQSMLFGGSQTHGRLGIDNLENDEQHYYAETMQIPQQTTVAGVIRKYILQAAGLLKATWSYSRDERELIISKIGERTDNVFDGQPYNGGILRQITPVIMSNGASDLLPVPMDFDLGEYRFVSDGCGKPYLVLDEFSAKEGVKHEQSWKAEDGPPIPYQKIFKYEEIIGINTDKMKKGYYRQKRLRLIKPYRYVVYVTLEEEQENFETSRPVIVEMGADRAKCEMTLSRCENMPAWFEYTAMEETTPGDLLRIVLLSDCWIPAHLLKECVFAVTEVVNFAMLAREEQNSPKSSTQYELVRRGSVLIAEADAYRKITEFLLRKAKARAHGFQAFLTTRIYPKH